MRTIDMKSPIIGLDSWSLLRCERPGTPVVFVVSGLDFQGTGVCSSNLVAFERHGDCPKFDEKFGKNARFSCEDDQGRLFDLLDKAPRVQNPMEAFFAFLIWCGNEYRPGEIRHAQLNEIWRIFNN